MSCEINGMATARGLASRDDFEPKQHSMACQGVLKGLILGALPIEQIYNQWDAAKKGREILLTFL